jgi:hypothetical protein
MLHAAEIDMAESVIGAALENFPLVTKKVFAPHGKKETSSFPLLCQFCQSALPSKSTPCNIIIAALLGRARNFGEVVARGHRLPMQLPCMNCVSFCPLGKKAITDTIIPLRR